MRTSYGNQPLQYKVKGGSQENHNRRNPVPQKASLLFNQRVQAIRGRDSDQKPFGQDDEQLVIGASLHKKVRVAVNL